MEKRIFTVLFIAVFATMLGTSIIEPFMGIYAESLGANGFLIGLIFGSFTLSRALFTPLIGRLSDLKGRKNLLVIGLAGYTILSFFYAAADTTSSLIIIRFFHGLASAMVLPISMAYIGDIAPKNEEGKYLGTFTISFFMGLAAGPVIGGALHYIWHMNAAFYAMGAISFLSLLLLVFMLPEINAHKKTKPSSIRVILKDKTMQAMFIFRLMNAFGISALMGFLPLLAERINITIFQIGFVVTANLLVSSLFQRYFGILADKSDKVAMLIAGSIMMLIALALMPLSANFYTLLLFNILMGFGSAVSIPAGSAITAQLGRKLGMGSVMGIFNTAFGIGGGIGPIIAGLIMVAFGLATVFVSSAIIVLIGTIIFYYLMKKNMEYKELIKEVQI
ncbi:MAG TPA: MFS transporter [Candidatus Nanoarchaeia archaeon]|nr:MFS transporter [Candidatus Nanoarchaeia archaeon]